MAHIGAQLIRAGRIDPADLTAALDRQRHEGGYVGRHLIESGAISRSAFHDALARSWHLETRDLVVRPPDSSVAVQASPEVTAELGWVACEIAADGAVVVATAVRPAEELLTEVSEYFPGRQIRLVACTERDLDWATLRSRRSRLAATERRDRRRDDVVGPVHHVMTLLGSIGAVALAVALPPVALAWLVLTAGALFVVGAALQSALAISAIADELVPAADGPRPLGPWTGADHAFGRPAPLGPVASPLDEDLDLSLPVYSVLVRLWGGESWLRIVLDHLQMLDYPRARLDAILLVAETDAVTMDAVRRVAPPEWVRVVRLPVDDFRDPVAASDHGLAIAHGRYVVAYERDAAPVPDQLRAAVAAFEADLLDLIDHRPDRAPLAGLRVARRSEVDAPSLFGRMTGVDDALQLDRSTGGRPGAVLPLDFCSTHFNMRLLRRLGGFEAATWQLPEAQSPTQRRARFEVLDSTSLRPRAPGPLHWMHERSQASAYTQLAGLRQLAAALGRRPDRPGLGEAVLGLSMPTMFLAYPVLLLGSLLTATLTFVDGGAQGAGLPLVARAAWLGVGETALVLGSAAMVAALVLVRRQGWRAACGAALLPLHWLLHAGATWSALLALATGAGRRRVVRNPASFLV
ncbi:hypothetical protein ACFQ0K_10700 [Nocardioides caeni]|uniref:Uncharacterized protein n=1 Tax=Nocardioides caeni TaxID=574700 RepID=A0A4S8N1T7_9ACTN|nr:hypothetical protein [Nocardioides caeni]THV09878.1 hypothetical protein E9934_15225 [Nocardioides caeni]